MLEYVKNNKKNTLITIVLFVVVVYGIIVIYRVGEYNKNIKAGNVYLQNKDYESAMNYYKKALRYLKNEGTIKKLEDTESFITIKKIVEELISQDKYEDAYQKAKEGLNYSEDAFQIMTRISSLIFSKKKYNEGEDYLNKGLYWEAVQSYKYVSELDKPRYNSVQSRIDECNKKEQEQQSKEKEEIVKKEVVPLLDKGKSKEADDILLNIYMYMIEDDEVEVAINAYIDAKYEYEREKDNRYGGFYGTKLQLAYIDPNYDRVYSTKIKQYVHKIMNDEEWASMHAEYHARMDKIEENLNKPEPAIGMTAEEVRNSRWGSPSKINTTITKYGTSEQWVYSNYKYVYLENGVVTAIQE